jgi:large subunit ribosomal protein L31
MKEKIHPKFYPEAKVTCSCGHKFTTGSTKPELRVELCSACHPFYTGERRMVDTAGRVERFKQRYGDKVLAAPAAVKPAAVKAAAAEPTEKPAKAAKPPKAAKAAKAPEEAK